MLSVIRDAHVNVQTQSFTLMTPELLQKNIYYRILPNEGFCTENVEYQSRVTEVMRWCD